MHSVTGKSYSPKRIVSENTGRRTIISLLTKPWEARDLNVREGFESERITKAEVLDCDIDFLQ
jgi:hypothetical protein